MTVTCSQCGTQYTVKDEQVAGRSRVRMRCTKCGQATEVDVTRPTEGPRTVAPAPAAAAPAPSAPAAAAPAPSAPASAAPAPSAPASRSVAEEMERTAVSQYQGLALPKDYAVTISVIEGTSKGLKHVLTKPRVVVGRLGGGADIELDDSEVSRQHCAVEVKQDVVRLRDLNSTNGTFVDDERITKVELEHLSEFRVGSSVLLLTILRKTDPADVA